jgi:hypothetical protein
VLEATYRLLSKRGGFIDCRDVNEEFGRSPDDESTGDVLEPLGRTGYISTEHVLGSALPIIIMPTEKGLQQTAGWPQEGQEPKPEPLVSPAPLGVPPEALQGLLAWANAERPDVALLIASGFLSNPAKEYVSSYVENNRPPFRVKYWERLILDKLARNGPASWTASS